VRVLVSSPASRKAPSPRPSPQGGGGQAPLAEHVQRLRVPPPSRFDPVCPFSAIRLAETHTRQSGRSGRRLSPGGVWRFSAVCASLASLASLAGIRGGAVSDATLQLTSPHSHVRSAGFSPYPEARTTNPAAPWLSPAVPSPAPHAARRGPRRRNERQGGWPRS